MLFHYCYSQDGVCATTRVISGRLGRPISLYNMTKPYCLVIIKVPTTVPKFQSCGEG